MRKIILKGASNTGKTYTLKCLIRLMLEAHNIFKLFACCRNFTQKLNDNTPDKNGNIPDVWAEFCYMGVHVLVTTRGDSPSDTIKEFERLGLGCDIFVCACHDTIRSQKALKEYFKATDDDFVDKEVIVNRAHKNVLEKTNNKQAQELLDNIKNTIKPLT